VIGRRKYFEKKPEMKTEQNALGRVFGQNNRQRDRTRPEVSGGVGGWRGDPKFRKEV